MRRWTELHFQSHDGARLFYRHTRSEGTSRGAIVLLHRGHEHSGRMLHVADELGLPDFDVFAWDARGHGKSPGPRGYSPSFAHSVRDLDAFVAHLGEAHGVRPADIAVVAQSVGAVLAATWVHDYAPAIRALVLAAPAFKVKLYVPFARPGLKLLQRLRGEFFVQSYVKARFLTHDAERIASFEADPEITRAISVNVLLGLYEAAERVVADARAITVPTQVLISGADWVVHHGPQHRFYENLGAPVKERLVLPGFFHDTLGESERAVPIAAIRRFLTERFAEPLEVPSLLAADLSGHTRDEADRLATPLRPLSPRGLYWAGQRASIAAGALLSEGMALGRRTGFDSGSTLDYVYRNEPRGRGPLGRMADRAYLESIGWRGIRVRKRHIEELLRLAIAELAAAGRPVRIVDIAAGHGRYVLDAIEGAAGRPERILLRDYSALNVDAGRALIGERGLADIAAFEFGNAFDGEDLAGLLPRPTLALVSGLYELFPDNRMIRASLGGLARATEPGGYLIYTNQPWHPQIELIARALTSHRDGAAWVMRRRTQGEMDQLVAAAGFDKLTQRIDPWGIFTVSLARRRAD
ncbi:bifunctional alpha/beta hydrolase/class I SAM-dependent methyltransferase [Methylobrevis albus]|uniref:Bifunctional alpha/beta hydrolase/class I SAM-dependent methyltransferase n=1 Tax=Methylobrevis albus TaxID=2793297 RepID=A0A931I0X5_9HYPH|nr:bifunctional alpha/beta hydrolase/class I SAM-dependent methyltransferase [Methylobrevis albus]MBH0236923.1 bifunctional alpha/beta hydrolase/class I SAM-dependent methyltransferase [Methylobrevis albus]